LPFTWLAIAILTEKRNNMSNSKNRKFKFNGRTFKSLGEWLDYLKAGEEENARILLAKQQRPLREGDQMHRITILIDGVAHWSSSIIREDGEIEVWVKRYVDDDDTVGLTTHENYTLVAGFRIPPSETDDD
jgi:hypothetical protein